MAAKYVNRWIRIRQLEGQCRSLEEQETVLTEEILLRSKNLVVPELLAKLKKNLGRQKELEKEIVAVRLGKAVRVKVRDG